MIPKKYTRDDLIGRKCRLIIPIRNGAGCCVSSNTVCIIKDVVRGHGFTIQTEACPYCGQSAYITGVARNELQLIGEDAVGQAEELLRVRAEAVQHLLDACRDVAEYCESVGIDAQADEAYLSAEDQLLFGKEVTHAMTLFIIKKALAEKERKDRLQNDTDDTE